MLHNQKPYRRYRFYSVFIYLHRHSCESVDSSHHQTIARL